MHPGHTSSRTWSQCLTCITPDPCRRPPSEIGEWKVKLCGYLAHPATSPDPMVRLTGRLREGRKAPVAAGVPNAPCSSLLRLSVLY
jgi:hypothetical protein